MRIASAAQGSLIVSVDVSTDVLPRFSELAAPFLQQGVPVTWVIAEPQALARPLSEMGVSNADVAIAADDSWVGTGCSRGRFAHELQRRVAAAAVAGMKLSTISLPDNGSRVHADLLVKHQIRCIRQGRVAARDANRAVQTLRYGLWRVAVTTALGERRTWSRGRMGARQAVHFVARHGGVAHVRVPAAMGASREFSDLLQLAQTQQAVGRMRIVDMSTLAEQLTPVRKRPPMHSILRRAA